MFTLRHVHSLAVILCLIRFYLILCHALGSGCVLSADQRVEKQKAAVEGACLQLADIHTAQEGFPDFHQLRWGPVILNITWNCKEWVFIQRAASCLFFMLGSKILILLKAPEGWGMLGCIALSSFSPFLLKLGFNDQSGLPDQGLEQLCGTDGSTYTSECGICAYKVSFQWKEHAFWVTVL